MLDLNSLNLYQKKISSYIDKNVLTFPTQSKINSLFNEVHKYKIRIFNKPLILQPYYHTTVIRNLTICQNGKAIPIINIKDKSNTEFTATLNADKNYQIHGTCEHTIDSRYKLSNMFYGSCYSSPYYTYSNVYLDFELSNLTEISYYPNMDSRSLTDYNEVQVFCDDEEIFNDSITLPKTMTANTKINIIFDDGVHFKTE